MSEMQRPTPGSRPEELPPVTPPSAGFIVQLFLIPALIVLAVVAVWALFGKLSESKADWAALVSELGSSNEHRRWRAAQGLANLIETDRLSPPTDREPLTRNPQIAEALANLFKETLGKTTPNENDISTQQYLAVALGTLDADSITLPVLASALDDQRDVQVRKNALMSIATIAGRHFDRETSYGVDGSEDVPATERRRPKEPTISNPEVMAALRRSAQSPEPVIRHVAAYALGNIGGTESTDQLKVMLLDGDRAARANAVTGLARNAVPEAIPVLIQLLKEVQTPLDLNALKGKPDPEILAAEQNYQVEQPALARGCLRASFDLWPLMSSDQQTQVKAEVKKLSESFFSPDVRLQATALINRLQDMPSPTSEK